MGNSAHTSWRDVGHPHGLGSRKLCAERICWPGPRYSALGLSCSWRPWSHLQISPVVISVPALVAPGTFDSIAPVRGAVVVGRPVRAEPVSDTTQPVLVVVHRRQAVPGADQGQGRLFALAVKEPSSAYCRPWLTSKEHEKRLI